MKGNQFFCLVIYIIFFCQACSPANDNEKTAEVKTGNNAVVNDNTQLPGCYGMIIEKDTALLHIDTKGIFVTGTLLYKAFEKNNNTGTIQGTINNDVIKTWFSVRTGGRITVKEVYFKIIKDKLAEAYGDVEMRNDSAYFKYPATLKYEEQHPYMKIDCK